MLQVARGGRSAWRTAAAGIVVLVGVLLIAPRVGAVGVRPLTIDIAAQPGDSKEFELILSPGQGTERVHLSLYRAAQLPTGELSYLPGDPASDPALGWVRLEKNQVDVEPGAEVQVRGHVVVPLNAPGGSHTVVIMVEPERPAVAGQITVRMVYAVRVTINVDRPGLRPQLQADLPTLQADEEKRPYVQISVKNASGLKYPVTGEATIRDAQRRLVQRVPLSTPAARQAGLDQTPIYPGAQLLLNGTIDKPLPPGDYEVRAFLSYADGLQLIRTATVTVKEGQFAAGTAVTARPADLVQASPAQLSAVLRPGGLSVQVVNVKNGSDQPVHIEARLREIAPNYERSVLRQLQVELRGASGFDLQPQRQGRVIVSIQAPRDLTIGGYYGWLDLGVFIGQDLAKTYSLPISVVIPGDWPVQAEILDLEHAAGADGELLSVSVRNDTPVEIAPTGTITLVAADGSVAGRFNLGLPEGTTSILPGKTALLLATAPSLKTGTYKAQITLQVGGQQVATAEKALDIEPQTGSVSDP
ncbi:MAG: hypothetical protein IMX01_06915 [Limnochordaceae bacterium]|nr:hypothetical protein [Limnochordaceae bacterium]